MARKHKTASDNPALGPAYKAAIDEARADVDAGKTAPYDEVRRWLLSWGTEKKLPPEMQVRFADAALTDIENIRTYISRDNPFAATRIAAAVVAAADRSSVNPQLGRLGAMPGTFEQIVRPYVLVYRDPSGRDLCTARLARTATAAGDLTDVYTPTWCRDAA
jgi:plasmid stabilization system protein ParE